MRTTNLKQKIGRFALTSSVLAMAISSAYAQEAKKTD
jgi:hypothetical protein